MKAEDQGTSALWTARLNSAFTRHLSRAISSDSSAAFRNSFWKLSLPWIFITAGKLLVFLLPLRKCLLNHLLGILLLHPSLMFHSFPCFHNRNLQLGSLSIASVLCIQLPTRYLHLDLAQVPQIQDVQNRAHLLLQTCSFPSAPSLRKGHHHSANTKSETWPSSWTPMSPLHPNNHVNSTFLSSLKAILSLHASFQSSGPHHPSPGLFLLVCGSLLVSRLEPHLPSVHLSQVAAGLKCKFQHTAPSLPQAKVKTPSYNHSGELLRSTY